MSIRSSKLAMAVLGAGLVVGVARCDGTRDEDEGLDAAVVKRDAGVRPDASTIPPDGGEQIPPDGGGFTPPAETTIPAINNLDAQDHPAANSKVHFKGVVMSPLWRITKSTSNTDSRKWSCLYGVYMADANATTAEHNGLIVVSKTTVNADTKDCVLDSALHKAQGDKPLEVGEELDITGFYNENCYKPSGSSSCQDQFEGKGISIVQISANFDEDVKRTGEKPAMKSTLPATVTIEDINSAGGSTGITALGSKWWKYRSVLVKLENVKATKVDEASCNWLVGQGDGASKLIVNDEVMFDGTDCKHRPALNAEFTSLSGFVYWTFNSTQLSPRSKDDSAPAMP